MMEITKIKEQIINKTEQRSGFELKPVLKCIISFIAGLLMMNPFVLGQFSPFAVSVICALESGLSACSGAGGIIGAFLFFDGTLSVKYVTIILFCILVRNAAERLFRRPSSELVVCANAFAGTFLISVAIMLAASFDAEEFSGVIFESALAAVGAYIFSVTARVVWSSKKLSLYTTEEFISLLMTFDIFIMHFYKYKLFFVSPVIMILLLTVLVAAKVKNGYGGAICGVCAGFALGLSNDLGFTCIGIVLGGLLCGELCRRSRLYGVGGFFVCVCLCGIADGSLSAYVTIAESIISCGIFFLIPEKQFNSLSKRINAPTPIHIKTDGNQKLVHKLNAVSYAIKNVSECVDTVQRSLKPVESDKLNSAVKYAWTKVCDKCELKESCRAEVKAPSEEAIERLAAALRNNAELDETRFPKGFYSACYSFGEMQTAIKNKYTDFITEQNARLHIEHTHGLMPGLFKSMADILQEFADDFDEEISINSDAAELCAAEAREFGLEVISTGSYLDRFGRLFVLLTVTRPSDNFNVTAFTDNLSNVLGTSFELPELIESESITLKFSQKQTLDISVGAFSRPTDAEQVCGDYYRSFCDENGRYIIILSDGMGTGSRAAVDSVMTSELFSKLIKTDIGFDCALSIANSAMLVKSSDESLATLDVVCIDMYTGQTDFLKAGAAATYIRHRGKVAMLEPSSLPVGILSDIRFSRSTASLESGDIILMVSDGILGDCNGWIQQELKLWQAENPPRALAEFIVSSACERKLAKHRDDMTAIAIYIK